MMQDTATTLRGRIGSDPIMKHVKDTCVTTFRMAITRWRFASEARPGAASYVEDGAHWYTIETWDTLAQNVFRSCRKGDPRLSFEPARSDTTWPGDTRASRRTR